jgi:ATP-dependent helicase/nuclease subunit A
VSGAAAAAPGWAESGLTDEQEAAVSRRSGELSLSAAAGSGKTSVLVERFVRAVREDGVAPGRILAITFTERAAGELRARARARLLDLGERQSARDTEAAFVGTFHGFCARLLRAHPLAAGLDPAFAILDEGLAGRLRERAFERALEGFLEGRRREAVDLLAAYKVDRVRSIVAAVHGELRSRGQRHPRLPVPVGAQQFAGEQREAVLACTLLDELLGRFHEAYEELKERRGSLDFDDLELRAAALLSERESIRRAWSERFELLMVDEFQDTNPRQLGILRALARENLFTVGDELQSIYGFRHADVRLFRARAVELSAGGGNLALTRNFRSGAAVLAVVNALFATRFEGFSPLVAGRDGDEPRDGEPVVELLLTDSSGWEGSERLPGGAGTTQAWRQAEAMFLAARVAELVAEGRARPGEVAVLLRATSDLEVFERALQLRGLRTIAAVGAFWGHQQVVDLIAYLRALANPLDDLALHSALASPLAGCSSDGLALLARAARAGAMSVWEAALGVGSLADEDRLSEPDAAAVARFCALLDEERAGAQARTISNLIERGLERTRYREHVLGLDWGERRLANVHKLLRLARRFQAAEGRDLRGFLDHVEHLQRARRSEPDAPVEGVEPDAIRLMTIHAAKGLEFPVVCVADLGRAPNVQTPELLLDGQRIGLRLVRLDGGEAVAALDYEELCAERRAREAEEEDRILYVAMTRARDRLLISGSVDFGRWPPSRRTPISWLAPALAPELPELLAEGELPELSTLGPGPVPIACRLNRAGAAGASAVEPALEPSPGPPEPPGPEHGAAPARPVEAMRAPPAAPANLSYSSLNEFARCGYRFYLERVLRLPEDVAAARGASRDAGLDPRERGTLVHRLMETLDFAAPGGPSSAALEEAIAELGLRPSGAEREEIATLVAAAGASGPAVRIAAARILGREHPFALSLGEREPLLSGVIDLLAVEPDGCHLVLDYKSDRIAPGADLELLVREEYEIQRMLYALAVLRGGAASVEVVHWFLERPEEPVGASFSAERREELEAAIGKITTHVGEGRYAVSARPHRALCLTCPGRGGLCSWPESETLRETPGQDEQAREEDSEDPLTLF